MKCNYFRPKAGHCKIICNIELSNHPFFFMSKIFTIKSNRSQRLLCLSRTLIAALLLTVGYSSLKAQSVGDTFDEGTLTYKITSISPANVAVKKYYGSKPTGSLSIPSTVNLGGNSYSVTEIGSMAFNGCTGLTEVTIPDLVTKIGYCAFYGCTGLTKITIPDLVNEIEYDAFHGCTGLMEITIPNSVTAVGKDAFNSCSSLTQISIPQSLTSIGDFAFTNCTGLVSFIVDAANTAYSAQDGVLFNKDKSLLVHYPLGNERKSYTIPSSVKIIKNNAFSRCATLTQVIIPTSVNSIEDYAFYKSTGLTEVIIPNSVNSIGYMAFYECTGLREVTIGNSLTTIGDHVFSYCTGLTQVNISNSVTVIGGDAFTGCTGLVSFIVDAANTAYSSLDGVLFNKDKSLLLQYPASNSRKAYTIPNSVTVIGRSAFSYSIGLTEVTIPNLVTEIGRSAFYYCIGLTAIISHIEAPDAVVLGTNVFYNVPKATCELQVPKGKVDAYKAADQWKDFTRIVEMVSTGIGLSPDAPQWSVHPNPVQDVLTIGSANSALPTVKVYSLSGTLLLEKKSLQIDVSHLPAGVYIIDIDGSTERFVKL